MPASKDGKMWRCQFYYTDWQGVRHKKNKRGFRTKGEAEEWERNFRQQQQKDLNMTFENFIQIYYVDMEHRLRSSSYINKKYIIDLKILPYFKNKIVSEITPSDIRKWQNELMSYKDENGKPYSQTYLKTISNQMAAIFNYAEQYYDLKSNPYRKAGSFGRSRSDEMKIWTKEEFETFLKTVEDKPDSRLAFMILFWTGMRIGELLALTYSDIDFDNRVIHITKSFQRIKGEDVVSEPKTERGKRDITLPVFLAEEIEEYCKHLYGILPTERMFTFTKSYMEHEIRRGIKESGVRQIHLHCLRHSHCSMLISLGYQPLEIAKRLGHEKVETTLNTYSHLYPNKQMEMADKLDQILREDKKDAGNP